MQIRNVIAGGRKSDEGEFTGEFKLDEGESIGKIKPDGGKSAGEIKSDGGESAGEIKLDEGEFTGADFKLTMAANKVDGEITCTDGKKDRTVASAITVDETATRVRN